MRFYKKCLCKCLRIHEGELTAFYSKSECQMFSFISGGHLGAPSHGLQHGISILCSLKFRETF